jgi:hypothetical protein
MAIEEDKSRGPTPNRGCVADPPQQWPRVRTVWNCSSPPERNILLRLTLRAQSRSGIVFEPE